MAMNLNLIVVTIKIMVNSHPLYRLSYMGILNLGQGLPCGQAKAILRNNVPNIFRLDKQTYMLHNYL
jgi:hypothetical protein